MKKTIDFESIGPEEVIVSNMRHFEALTLAYEAITKVMEGLKSGISGDFLAQDIRECLHYLGEITGEVSTDEILGHIFKHFCIGKQQILKNVNSVVSLIHFNNNRPCTLR
eukprot:TRINITY_DN35020_c0_g1_i2.p3 TRINITY_DN35020_c0_g1~~TRINITY_DN35020_c0_g1_i2.p3  ORF type:complete len:110 (+),score=10.35 TRINITY_DN35020_c0_g1_i2:285-614(+)